MDKVSLESQTALTKLLDNTLLLLPPDKLTIWLIGMPLVILRMLILFSWKGLIDELRPGYQTEGKCTSMWAVTFIYLFICPKKCSVSTDWFTRRGVFLEQPVNGWIIYDSIIKTPPLA